MGAAATPASVAGGMGLIRRRNRLDPKKLIESATLATGAYYAVVKGTSSGAGQTTLPFNLSVRDDDATHSITCANAASNGTPIASVTNTPTGVYVVGSKNGFEVRAAADTTIKTLKLYLGTFAARGHLAVSRASRSSKFR